MWWPIGPKVGSKPKGLAKWPKGSAEWPQGWHRCPTYSTQKIYICCAPALSSMHVIAVHKYLTHAALRPILDQASQNKTQTWQGHPNADKSLPCLTKGMAKERALSLRAQARHTCNLSSEPNTHTHTRSHNLCKYYAANPYQPTRGQSPEARYGHGYLTHKC